MTKPRWGEKGGETGKSWFSVCLFHVSTFKVVAVSCAKVDARTNDSHNTYMFINAIVWVPNQFDKQW
jgi:hypothetical protein